MTSLVNKYFNKNPTNEQNLVQKLVTEAIQIHGNTVYYLPRELQKLDLVFGEDVLSKFTVSLPIEMYIDSYSGYEGQGEMISKFGLEIRDQLTFLVATDRWEKEVTKIASSMWVSSRPQEGDLIYDMTTTKLFEIKFVDQHDVFHQLGKRTYSYKLKCELFQYNNEKIVSGVSSLDNFVLNNTLNLLDLQILQEDGSLLLNEAGTSIFLDLPHNEDSYDTTNTFKGESNILEFSVTNPFNE